MQVILSEAGKGFSIYKILSYLIINQFLTIKIRLP